MSKPTLYAYQAQGSGSWYVVDETKHHLPHVKPLYTHDVALKLAQKWEEIARRTGVTTFTGNDHLLFANELRAAFGLPVFEDKDA